MRFLCEIIKGESWAEHTERESEILRDGERGREKRRRERVWRWFLSKTVIFGSDHRPKSTQLFLAIATDHINIKLILGRLQIMKSTETIYFWRCLLSNGFSGAITSTRITMRFSILPPCIKLCASKVLDAKRKHESTK